MTPQEERNKRFDEKYPSGCFNVEPHDRDNLKSHITSEVNLTIEQVEKWVNSYEIEMENGSYQQDTISKYDLLSFLTTLKK